MLTPNLKPLNLRHPNGAQRKTSDAVLGIILHLHTWVILESAWGLSLSCSVLLKVHLSKLKPQSWKPLGLSTKHTYACFFFFFFIVLLKKYESLNSTARSWRKWPGSLIYYTNTIYYTNNFCLHIKGHKQGCFTILVLFVLCLLNILWLNIYFILIIAITIIYFHKV